jgi:nitrogen fixation negative regulator NifL
MPSAKCLAAQHAQPSPKLPPEVYLQAVDQADLAISITDLAANILFANESFTRVTGYTPGEVVGNNESMLSNRTTPREIYQSMWTALMEQRPWSGKLLNRKKSGQLYLAELTISPVVDAAGKTTHYPACTGTSPSSTGSSRWCATRRR